MANTILQLKKSGVTGNVPPSLAYGEMALNYADGKLYYKHANGSIASISTGSLTNSFATVNANSSLVIATSPTDILSFAGTNGVSVFGNTTSKLITIDTGQVYAIATAAYALANSTSTGITSSQYNVRYGLTGNVSLTNGTDNVIAFNNQSFDPQGWFNTGTSRFQPTIAGYYNITYVTWFQGGVVGTGQQFNAQIRKNENSIAITQQPESSNTVGQSLIVSDKVYLNGSSDYLTFTAYSSAGTVSLAAGNGTYFTAELSGVSALANATLSLAQSAYNQSNATIGVDATQNTRIGSIETVNANQNTSISIIQGVDAWQNTQITYVNQFAQSAYDKANTGGSSGIDQYARDTANGANGLAAGAYNTANSKLALTGGTITGDLQVDGIANVVTRLIVGGYTYEPVPNTIAQLTGSSDFYSQVNQQNLSANGTGDFVVTASNGTDTANYMDMGIAGETYDNTSYNAFPFVNPNDAYCMLVGDAAQDFGGNVFYGTTGSGTTGNELGDIVFIQGQNYDEVGRWKLGEGLVIKTGTASTSNVTGALQVQGGVGVTGSLYAGDIYDNGTRILTYIQDVNDTQNTEILSVYDYANTAYYLAFDANGLSQGAYDTANVIVGVNNTQNTNISIIQGVDTWQNTQITYVNQFAQNAYDKANAAYAYANTISGGGGGGGGTSYDQSLNIADPVVFQSVTANVYSIGGGLTYGSNAAFSTTTANQIMDIFSSTNYRTAKYIIQAISGSDVHSTEILLNHDDTNVYITEYANTYTNALMYINAEILSQNVTIYVNPFNSDTTVDYTRTTLIARSLGIQGDLMLQSGTEDLNTGSGTIDLMA